LGFRTPAEVLFGHCISKRITLETIVALGV
jgi:hypothetical protein